MLQTMHKYFNNKIKVLLFLILILTLKWQHGVYGESTVTYDAPGGVDVNGRTKEIKNSSTERSVMSPMTTAPTEYEEKGKQNNDNNTLIYDNINENRANKLLQTGIVVEEIQQEGKNEQQTSKNLLKSTLSTAQELDDGMTKDQLNEKNNANVPGEPKYAMECSKDNNKDMACYENVQSGDINENENKQDINQNELTIDVKVKIQSQLIRQFALGHKKINRVNLFTCNIMTYNGDNDQISKGFSRKQMQRNKAAATLLEQLFIDKSSDTTNEVSKGLILKVIQIDHLIPKKRQDPSSVNQRNRFERTNARTAGTSNSRSSLTNPNWLDQVLRPEYFSQLVVVDLSCPVASRKLLEMASNKALFNSLYHWLLMEDYTFNGQTEINDADDMKNKMNSDSQTGTRRSNTTTNSGGDDDNVGMENIENFLEKLNININTELILAKRRVRSITPTVADAKETTTKTTIATESTTAATVAVSETDTTFKSEAQSIVMASVAENIDSSPNYPLADADNETLQTMDYYILYDVWSPGRQYGGKLNTSEVGEFTAKGLALAAWYSSSSFIMRRMNMHLARIRCLVVVTHQNNSNSLHEYLTSHNDTHLDSMNRFNFALLSHVRDLFNFRPCFIFRHPRSTKKDRIVFLQPFSNDVWILLAGCGLATILLLWLLTSLETEGRPASAISTKSLPVGRLKRRFIRWGGLLCGYDIRDDNAATQKVGMFLESLLFYVGSICQQGLTFSTRSFSGRCIVTTSLLFSFAIYQFYSASIVGTLLMEKPKTIRTLRDLIHSSLEIGIEDIVYNRDYFLRTKDPDAQELYAKKVTSMPAADGTGFVDAPPDNLVLPTSLTPMTEAQKAKAYRDILHSHETGAHAKTNEASNWYEPEYGVAKIKKGHFAFHVDVATAYKIMADTFTEKEICDLTEIQLFPPQKMVSIVQKGSPLRKPITYGLRRVTEVGLMDYERKIWHSPKPRCVKQLHTDDLQVDMQTFTSAFFVLLFGFLVSGLILSLEIMHHRMWQQYTTTTIIPSTIPKTTTMPKRGSSNE
ncbi:ionotropic receptor 64a isoform X2 [Musca autumnalis]|uniref:ionotropic receptor 64a isoform X2 n=1 Tax=Musca autumnalis TaxID=221902 RepID=UPI003CF6F433